MPHRLHHAADQKKITPRSAGPVPFAEDGTKVVEVLNLLMGKTGLLRELNALVGVYVGSHQPPRWIVHGEGFGPPSSISGDRKTALLTPAGVLTDPFLGYCRRAFTLRFDFDEGRGIMFSIALQTAHAESYVFRASSGVLPPSGEPCIHLDCATQAVVPGFVVDLHFKLLPSVSRWPDGGQLIITWASHPAEHQVDVRGSGRLLVSGSYVTVTVLE